MKQRRHRRQPDAGGFGHGVDRDVGFRELQRPRRVVDFEALAEEGVISPSDLNLLTWVETAEDAWKAVQTFYQDSEEPNCG